MIIPKTTSTNKHSIVSREVMSVCNCQPVNLYSIPYKYSGKSALSLFLVSKSEPALNRLRQVKTRENSIKEARKKQDFSSNQCSDADRRDKQRTYSLSACFRAANRVLTGLREIAPQVITAQFSSKVHVHPGKSLRIKAQPFNNAACLRMHVYSVPNRRVDV